MGLFPVGFPDEGTFSWLDGFLEKNPQYVEISDRAIQNWIIKSGIRKQFANAKWHSNDKPEYCFGLGFVDDQSIRKGIMNMAPLVPRHYVIMEVKENLVAADRKANLQRFNVPHFKKIAKVVMGEPDKEYKDKTYAQLLADKHEKERKKAIAKRQKEIKAKQEAAQAEAKKRREAAEAKRKEILEAAAKKKKEAEEKKKAEEAAKKAAEAGEDKKEEEKKDEEKKDDEKKDETKGEAADDKKDAEKKPEEAKEEVKAEVKEEAKGSKEESKEEVKEESKEEKKEAEEKKKA